MGLRDRIASDREQSDRAALDGTELYRRRLLEEVDFAELAELSESQRRVRLERIVGGMLTREGPVMTTSQRSALIRRVIDEAVGLGVLEPLLADETVTEIMVNGPSEVWIEREGRIERADAHFTSETQLYQTIDRIVSQVNRRVDESSPMVDARLPTRRARQRDRPAAVADRSGADHSPLPATVHPAELVESAPSMTPPADSCPRWCAPASTWSSREGTGAGKTTLLNALSAAILPASGS